MPKSDFDLPALLQAIQGKQILIVGDIMLDEFVGGKVERISPEAPVPVLKVTSRTYAPGGAANVAHNVLVLGGIPFLTGKVGEDWAGKKLLELLSSLGISMDGIVQDPSISTTLKTRFIGAAQQMLRVDVETDSPSSPPIIEKLLQAFHRFLPQVDAVVFSDYAKGMSASLGKEITQQCKKAGIPLIVDPKPATAGFFSGCDILTPNASEASHMAKIPLDTTESIENVGKKLLQEFQLRALIITRGERGMSLFQGEEVHHFPAAVREVYDVTGAGDTVLAVIGLCVAARIPLTQVIPIANLAAGVVVQKLGTATASPLEILALTHQEKILPLPLLIQQTQRWKAQGYSIVFTNGVFDLFHPGHLYLLQEAKKQGDRLIVALNSDASVRKIKSPDRPILPQQERARIISSLQFVDAVVFFDEPTPLDLIQKIQPNVLVKGRDYSPEQVVGKAVVESSGGKVVLIPLLQGYSTTSLLERLRHRA